MKGFMQEGRTHRSEIPVLPRFPEVPSETDDVVAHETATCEVGLRLICTLWTVRWAPPTVVLYPSPLNDASGAEKARGD